MLNNSILPITPFSPGGTASIGATDATGSVAFGSGSGQQIRVVSLSANALAFIKFGDSSVEAAVTDLPIVPGEIEIFTRNPADTHVAAICAGGEAATLYFTTGAGQ